MNLDDLTGKRFGDLVVVKREGTHVTNCGNALVTWLCKCDCGNTKVITGKSLKHNKRKNCGCKRYVYDFNETREEGNALYIKVKDREVIIDKEDINKILPNRVCINGSGYAVVYRNRLVHRLVVDCPEGYVIDHINHNTLDNRKSNLRIVARSENDMNRCVTSNTGEYGISLCNDRYYRVTVDDKYCGIRKTLEEAIELRNKHLLGTRQLELNYYLKEEEKNG